MRLTTTPKPPKGSSSSSNTAHTIRNVFKLSVVLVLAWSSQALTYQNLDSYVDLFVAQARAADQPRVAPFVVPAIDITAFPQWMQNYFAWHRQMRERFPGERLLTDDQAPKLLIRTCTDRTRCGGINDRLGKLPWDVYLANQTNRLLLMNWCRPFPLETFFVPNLLDWTVPDPILFAGMENCSSVAHTYTDMFQSYSSQRPQQRFWDKDVSAAIYRANTGMFRDVRILSNKILGHEQKLQERLDAQGPNLFFRWDSALYGQLFWYFFQPSPLVSQQVQSTMDHLSLVPFHYTAVHCRVRHPKAPHGGLKVETKGGGPIDKHGLLFEGSSREFAITTATRALTCLQQHSNDTKRLLPVYFFSDSEDLVQFMTQDLHHHLANASAKDGVDLAARTAVRATGGVVAPRPTGPVLHLDRSESSRPHDYLPTFVDLLIGAAAKCLAIGVGNYGLFAGRLSGTQCMIQYDVESFGDDGIKSGARQCSAAAGAAAAMAK